MLRDEARISDWYVHGSLACLQPHLQDFQQFVPNKVIERWQRTSPFVEKKVDGCKRLRRIWDQTGKHRPWIRSPFCFALGFKSGVACLIRRWIIIYGKAFYVGGAIRPGVTLCHNRMGLFNLHRNSSPANSYDLFWRMTIQKSPNFPDGPPALCLFIQWLSYIIRTCGWYPMIFELQGLQSTQLEDRPVGSLKRSRQLQHWPRGFQCWRL